MQAYCRNTFSQWMTHSFTILMSFQKPANSLFQEIYNDAVYLDALMDTNHLTPSFTSHTTIQFNSFLEWTGLSLCQRMFSWHLTRWVRGHSQYASWLQLVVFTLQLAIWNDRNPTNTSLYGGWGGGGGVGGRFQLPADKFVTGSDKTREAAQAGRMQVHPQQNPNHLLPPSNLDDL